MTALKKDPSPRPSALKSALKLLGFILFLILMSALSYAQRRWSRSHATELHDRHGDVWIRDAGGDWILDTNSREAAKHADPAAE
jgi:hypothetical protein